MEKEARIKVGDFVINKAVEEGYKIKEVFKVVGRIEEIDYCMLKVIVGDKSNKRKVQILEENYRIATINEIKADKIKTIFDGR
jgi:hypothetical protein